MNVPVLSQEGKELEKLRVDEQKLGGHVHKRALRDYVIMYEANQRQGTVSTKTRGEVAGTGKKPWRQKGTGRARVGSRRSPLWRAGGKIFGPKPRDYSYSIPKKAKHLALKSALLSKFQDGEATVVDTLTLAAPKTKEVARVLRALGLADATCLIAIPKHDETFWRCARNIQSVIVRPVAELNAYEVLHQRRLLIVKEALQQLVGAQA
jgi:large subunit ribosomal protein L4